MHTLASLEMEKALTALFRMWASKLCMVYYFSPQGKTQVALGALPCQIRARKDLDPNNFVIQIRIFSVGGIVKSYIGFPDSLRLYIKWHLCMVILQPFMFLFCVDKLSNLHPQCQPMIALNIIWLPGIKIQTWFKNPFVCDKGNTDICNKMHRPQPAIHLV